MLPPLSVSEFVDLVNQTLVGAYPSVTVEGEVSGYKTKDNFIFFDLKDAKSTVNCFMMSFHLKVPLEDGLKVRVTGVPKLTAWGRFSLTVSEVELAGEGALKRAYEILKAKLTTEGLFEPARKRPLPEYPTRIGLVTSKESAAYGDFNKIINARWGGLEIMVADVRVQGKDAPEQIVAAIEHLNQLAEPIDVLVIIRGGGSLEDLQAFNSEHVARAVAGSRAPTIVGVGHEVDTSLSDLAADVRAATPTDAAKIVVPDRAELVRYINQATGGLQQHLSYWRDQTSQELNSKLNRLERFLEIPGSQIDGFGQRLLVGMDQMNIQAGSQLESLARVLHTLDPRAVLKRGYAIARRDGAVIHTADGVEIGDEVVVQLAKDKLVTEVKNVQKSH